MAWSICRTVSNPMTGLSDWGARPFADRVYTVRRRNIASNYPLVGFRNAKHRLQWKSTIAVYGAPLAAKPIDTIRTEDVLSVLRPIWTTKPETASRVRGRIEKILDAAKAKGFRTGENPAQWRG